MIRSTVQVARLCVAGAIATFPLFSAAPVAAVTPPPVDDSMLPKPSPPAPPRPTEQQERCAAASPAEAKMAAVGQLNGLELQQAWE
ncbi:MAG: Type secretion-associated serine protease mycosin, partial [Mycobacterium sp.]|nr:Type secretion-associated serine protease mycosin [Mycobacterium sp.]